MPAWVNIVDWQLRNVDIARLLGFSRERVRQVRSAMGKPSVGWTPPRTRELVDFAKEHRAILDRAPLVLVRKLIPISNWETFHKILRMAGVTLPPKVEKRALWQHLADWRLPDASLFRIWKLRSSLHVCKARSGNGYPSALWDLRYHAARRDKRLHRLVKKQEALAQTYRALLARKDWLGIARLIHTYRQQHSLVAP